MSPDEVWLLRTVGLMNEYGLAWSDLVDRPPHGRELLWLDGYRSGQAGGLKARREAGK